MAEEITEEQKKEMEGLKEFYSRDDTKRIIGELVNQFSEVFGFQWFTMDDCLKVFKKASVEQLVDITRSLYLCGFLLVSTKGEKERFRLSANSMKKVDNDSPSI